MSEQVYSIRTPERWTGHIGRVDFKDGFAETTDVHVARACVRLGYAVDPEPEPIAVADPEPEPIAVADPEPEPIAVADPEPEPDKKGGK